MSHEKSVVRLTGREGGSTRDRIGGKAESLDQLIGAGLPVPPACCVTVEAFAAFLRHARIEAAIERWETLDEEGRAQLRQQIERGPLPDELRAGILAAYRELGGGEVAVRSSGVEEDGAALSFAGQHDTFLYVEGEEQVLQSVRRCWASALSERARAYRSRGGALAARAPRMAVVIQRMVEADVAGVLFTADPFDGDARTTVVEACWGDGEGIVSGRVSTDTYRVDVGARRVVERTLRHKVVMSRRSGPDGAALRNVPPERVAASTLTDEQAVQLAALGERIRLHYGKPVDVEWVLRDGALAILQARPITAVAPRRAAKLYANPDEPDEAIRENAVFSRMDTGEIVTGLMTPLGLSFCRFYQRNVHGPAVKPMGLLDIGDPKDYMGYIQGHVYLNISASAHLLTQCPPTQDQMKFIKRYATDDLDLSRYPYPYGAPTSGLGYVRSAAYWLGWQVRNAVTADRTVERMIALRRQETARFQALDLRGMSLRELDAELRRVDRNFLAACAAYMPFFLQSFALYDALAGLCAKWFGGKGTLQNRIKASLNNLRTIEVTRAVRTLAERAGASPALRRLLLETPLDELPAALQRDREGQAFWQTDLGAFLSEFGTRGRQEFELSIPRWFDDPKYILQLVRLYLGSDVQLEERMSAIDKGRDEETRRLLATLPWSARLALKTVIGLYSKTAARREATRPTFIAETWFYRRIVVEVLSRLAARGLASMDDLPYLDFNELREYVAGRKPLEEAFARELIERNRRQHLINLRSPEPPMAVIGGCVPQREAPGLDDADAPSGAICGLGASPGITVGRARVIVDLARQAEELQRGEILVAPYTDASWTPLFLLAAGVVADVGSMLSHSSIVSREFGIPAVVNTKHATRTIRTGDLLYLDGDAGTVRVEAAAADRAA